MRGAPQLLALLSVSLFAAAFALPGPGLAAEAQPEAAQEPPAQAGASARSQARGESKRLKRLLAQQERAVRELRAQLTEAQRAQEALTEQLQAAAAQAQEGQAERRRLRLQLEGLERSLRDARAANEQLQRDLSQRGDDLQAETAFKERLARQLALREAELQQTEAILSVMQAGRGPAPAPAAGAGIAASPRYPVTVFRVNEELQFLVLAVSGEGAPPLETVLLLETAGTEPLATVRITERDQIGFAIAVMLKRMDRVRPIREGDACFLRPLG